MCQKQYIECRIMCSNKTKERFVMSAFDKVIGYEKEELFQLCDMAKNPEKYAALGVKLPRGILRLLQGCFSQYLV